MKKVGSRVLSAFTAAFIALTLMISSQEAHALNVQLFRPNIGPNGTFRLWGSETLEPRKFNLGLYLNYADDPLIIINATTGAVVQTLATWIFTQDLIAEFGVHDRVTLGFDLPLSLVRHTPVGGGLINTNTYRVGDLSLYGRVKILDNDDKWVGLSVVPYIEVPTGSANDFTGDAGVNFGAKIAIDKKIKRFTPTLNVGYRGHGRQDFITQGGAIIPLDVDDEFTYGLGLAFDLLPERVTLISDIQGMTTFKDFASQENSSPIEVLGGVRSHFFDKRLTWNVGGGAGIRKGYGAPIYRIFSGVSWNFAIPEREEPTVKVVRNEVKKIILSGVNFEFDRATLTPQATQILQANLEALNQNTKLFISVEGHTDSRGGDEYNLRLSKNRASSVMNYLTKHVDNPSRLRSLGFGETRPLTTNDTEAGRAQNRRVEIRLLRALD